MSECPHCGSHDIIEVPEYRGRTDEYEMPESQPQLVAHCNDCRNDFDPDDPRPTKKITDADFETQFRRK